MLDDTTLGPTSVSINTTNRMSGKALSNKRFIMPQALNNHKKNSFFLWSKYSIADITYDFSNCMLGLHAKWISLNGSTGVTLDSNYISLVATSLTLITFEYVFFSNFS